MTATATPPAPIRRSWRRAVQCTPALVAPSRYVAELMELVLAISAPAMQLHYDRFRAHPQGRRLLDERPDLAGALADHEALAALPDGSLGRAYLDFVSQYRFDAAAFEQVHQLDAMGERLGWDDDLAYVMARGLQLHDVWHALGSYGPDWGGEGGVVAFTNGQLPMPGGGMLTGIFRALPGGVPRARWRRFLAEARLRGARADELTVAPYEELLGEPLDEVRARLRIEPVEVAHPGGIPYSTFRYGAGRALDEAYEPYRPAAA